MTDYLTTSDLIGIHKKLSSLYGGNAAIRDRGAMKAALYRPQTGDYDDLIAEAAALMESLATNQPFAEHNLRTAFAAADVFLRMNGFMIEGDPHSTHSYLKYLRDARDFRFDKIDPWLRELAQPIL